MTAKAKPVDAPSDVCPQNPAKRQARVVKAGPEPHALGPFRDDLAGLFLYSAGLPIEANPRALSLHGLPANGGSEALTPVIDFLLADEGLRGLLEPQERAFTCDYCWRVDGSEEIWIRAFSGPAIHEGAAAREVWLFDVSAEKIEQREVARSRDRMAGAQRVTRIGNWEWNLKSGKCLWSDELYRIFGQSATSFVPTPYNERWVHPGDVDRVRATMDGCIETGEPVSFEFRILRPSNEERVVEVHAEVVLDPSGTVIALTGAVNDVTRDKVIQRQLEDEKRKAERASRAKSEFMANMSHELRTPLNAIIGFSEVMRREMFGELGDNRYRDYAASILESGNHLLGLINDILDLAKVEAGKYKLREEVVDVAAVVDQCLKTLSVSFDRKALSLIRAIPDDLPGLSADRRVLQQILLNVLSNAVKFTDQGSVTVEVSCENEFLIRIRDTGVGMAPNDISRAFEPFEQIESNAALSHEGTGIGLSLTKQLLEAHGGRLQLTSELGVGTTVEACFPESRIVA